MTNDAATCVKICGLREYETVQATVQAGADWIGFVFAKSKRQVSPEQVAEISRDVPKSVMKVGVFVSPSLEELQRAIVIAGIDMIQIHGTFPKQIPGDIPIIRACSVTEAGIPEALAAETFDYLLLDAPPAVFAGGNGQTFNWQQVLRSDIEQYQVIVAGGLSSSNVCQAISYFQPFGVDVSSGVETKGQKDVTKIMAFLQQVKGEKHV